ncbi:MAG: hypothetical protein LBR26_12045 [Prevotella sp.]|jgi:hypothetical protein|nr:hypothetical protein [Prevotella sp.]
MPVSKQYFVGDISPGRKTGQPHFIKNRNKFFNTTDAEPVRTGVVEPAGHGVTVELQIGPVRTSVRRGRPIVALVAYAAQPAAIVVTPPGSGKEAATGLNVFADRTMIPEREYSLDI